MYRSEWEEFWRTATDSVLPNSNTYNDYVQTSTPPYNPYKYKTSNPVTEYYKTSTTQIPYRATSTTKNPYDDFNKNWYYAAFKNKIPQKNNYDWYTKKPVKSSLEEFNYLFHGRTTPENDIYTYTKSGEVGEYSELWTIYLQTIHSSNAVFLLWLIYI